MLKRRKELHEKLEIEIGDAITQTNQHLLARLNEQKKIGSAWHFNGRIYGTDEEGDQYKFNVFDNINQKLWRAVKKTKTFFFFTKYTF